MSISQKSIYREMDAEQLENEFKKHPPLEPLDPDDDDNDLAGAVIDMQRSKERKLINKYYQQLTGKSLTP